MTDRKRILIAAVGALALAGGLIALAPYGRALANTPRAAGWMMGGAGGGMAAMHNQMMAAFGNDMGAMHQAMFPLMAEMPAIHDRVVAELAARLEMTAEELQAALNQGTTLAALAEERGIAADALKGVMVGTMQQVLTDWVQEGRLDAEVAAQLRGQIAQHAEVCLTVDMSGMQSMWGMMGWGSN